MKFTQKMATDSYPDVTIADPSVVEHHGCPRGVDHDHQHHQQQQQQQHQGGPGRDTFVILQPNRRRYTLSQGQILVAVVIIVLTLVIAVLITAFVSRAGKGRVCPNCESTISEKDKYLVSGKPGDSKDASGVDKVPPPFLSQKDKDKPWSGIRLPRAFLPTLYEIRLQVDLDNFVFQGAVNITLRVNHSTRFIVFHRSYLDLDPVSVGMTSQFSPQRFVVRQFQVKASHFHVVELDREVEAGTIYKLSVGSFSGRVNTQLRGLYRSSYTMNGTIRYLAASQLQATDARTVFPCFDEPDMKSQFKVTIIYQEGYTALTNMPALNTTRHSPGWYIRHFDVTPVMSTYLLAFVIADFRSRNHTFPNGYQLRLWARPDAYDQTQYGLEFAIKTYQFFSKYFNIADDVPKADHVAVPDFSSGAMENWGLVIYRETALLYAPHISSSHNKFTVTLIVAHEIAHTWFGNMVTMRWWDDLWLNEGFASLLMYIAMDHVYPQWNIFAILVVNDIFPAMVKDALTTSHPVSSRIYDPEDIQQHFDSISYNKGMAVLRMMMSFAGKTNFRNALRLYVKRYRFSNADMSQLWATFSEFLNQKFDIASIMDTWTRQMGYPVVTVKDSGSGHLDLHQSRFLLDSSWNQPEVKADGVGNATKVDNPFGFFPMPPFRSDGSLLASATCVSHLMACTNCLTDPRDVAVGFMNKE